MEINELNVGDKVVCNDHPYETIAVITRITKTQIQAGGYKFNRSSGRLVGGSGYRSKHITILTPEAEARIRLKIKRRQLQAKLSYIVSNIDTLDEQDIIGLMDAVKAVDKKFALKTSEKII